jgi:hypothetical protein
LLSESLANTLTNLTTTRLIEGLIALILLWIIVSIPVYFAAKLVVGSRASFGGALLATLIGPIIFAVVSYVILYFTHSIYGGGLIALFIAFIAWLWVYKAAFHTGWLHAFAIAILAIIIAIVIIALFAFLLLGAHALAHLAGLSIF